MLVRVVEPVVGPVEDPVVPNFAADAWVGADIEPGRRAGLVLALVPALVFVSLGGERLEVSWEGVAPRVILAVVAFDAAFREVRLCLWARAAFERSLAASRAEGGFVPVGDLWPVAVGVVEAGLVDAWDLEVPMLDGRLETVLGASFSVGFDCAGAGAGSSGLGSAFFAGGAGASFGEGDSTRGDSSLPVCLKTSEFPSVAPLVC